MKRCPTCNQTFEEDWLSFCTNDGTSLVDFTPSRKEPPPTIRVTAPNTSPSGKPTFDLPGSYTPSPVRFAEAKPPAPSWQPPPSPATYSAGPQQGLAITSLIVGLISIPSTFAGALCCLGLIPAPVGIITGIISLVQIKSDPARYGGKPMAIIGIVSGALSLLITLGFILLYGLASMMGHMGNT